MPPSLRQLACECYSRLPSLGAGFSQGLKHTDSWEQELRSLLASLQVNIVDIRQTVMQNYFTMIMMVDISGCDIPFTKLVDEMMELGNQNGLVIHCMHEEIFDAMHTI